MSPHDPQDELDEEPSEEDIERFGGATQKCPECGTELYDDVEVCWKCGRALMAGDRDSQKWVVWVAVVLVMVILGGALWWVVR